MLMLNIQEKIYSSEELRSFIGQRDLEGYRRFAFKDDMIKLSVGFILGSAFNKVVCGISDYLVMPVMSYLISTTGEGWRDLKFVPVYGLEFEIGRLVGVFVDFLMVSTVLYLFYVKIGGLMRIVPKDQPKKTCPHCMSTVHAEAKKCPMCTGRLNVQERRTGSKNKRTKDAGGK